MSRSIPPGGGAPEPYAAKHALRFGFGLVMMLSSRWWTSGSSRASPGSAMPAASGLLVLVLLHGNVGKGAQRWIDIGPLQLQPSELMKILLVLALAAWFHRAAGSAWATRCSSFRRR